MSFEGSKTNKSKRSNLSQKTKSEKDNKSKNMSIGNSIPDIVYKNSVQNLKDMIELKKNLEEGEYTNTNDLQKNLTEFQNKNEEISKLYGDEENVKNLIEQDGNWKLNNDLFEERALKILSDVYGLKEYNLYPYFDVGFSKTKKSNVIKIYFNQIELSVEKEGPKFSALFLDDLDTYMFRCLEMPMIFHKYSENFTLTVISKDFKNSIDFDFKKGSNNEKVATTSFILAELNEDLMEIRNKIKEIKNEKDSSNDNEIKELYGKKLESYQKMLKLKEEFYSQNNIENELAKKKNELSILEEASTIRDIEDKEEEMKKKKEDKKKEEEEKLKKEDEEKRKKEEEDKKKEGEEKLKKEDEEKRKKEEEDKKKEEEEKLKQEQKEKQKKEDEKQKIKVMEDIKNYEQFLRKITFKFEQKDREIDGLFFTSKEIILQNTIGDILKIPQKRAIIVEVKNIKKYKTMVENIRIKKKLMNTLGFKTEDLFFIGILRGIDVDNDKKKEINNKYFKDLNMQNMIIIYPEKFNFLNVPLIEVKNEVKEKPKEDKPKENANLYDMIAKLIQQVNDLQNNFNSIKEKIK